MGKEQQGPGKDHQGAPEADRQIGKEKFQKDKRQESQKEKVQQVLLRLRFGYGCRGSEEQVQDAQQGPKQTAQGSHNIIIYFFLLRFSNSRTKSGLSFFKWDANDRVVLFQPFHLTS